MRRCGRRRGEGGGEGDFASYTDHISTTFHAGYDSKMTSTIPDSEAQFEALMCKIDEELVARRVKITARPWEAVRAVSIEFGVSLPIAGPSLKDTANKDAALSGNSKLV